MDIRFPYYHFEPIDAKQARSRIPAIVAALKGDNNSEAAIRRVYQWHEGDIQEELVGQVDFVWSHAVMEHVADVKSCYQRLTEYLKPGARMSHQIDMTSHSRTPEYNGHYKWSAMELVEQNSMRNPEDIINTLAPSFHKAAIEEAGNEITFNALRRGTGGITEKHPDCLVPDDEIDVAGQFIQSKKS